MTEIVTNNIESQPDRGWEIKNLIKHYLIY